MDEGSRGTGQRFQVRLWDLAVVVVGSAFVLDAARRSRVAWGGGLPDLAHAIGLTVLTFGLAVGLVVVGQWVRRLGERQGRAWALIWRVLAVGWLAGSLVEVVAAMQVAGAGTATRLFNDQAAMRLRLTTLMTTLGMVGLILAATPLGPRSTGATPKPRPRWGSWPSVVLAALVGLVVVALGHGFIPYLVLIAMEAVWNALSRAPLVPRPILFDRMATASLEALPGLVGCLATAIWIDDDLRAAARDPLHARPPRPWPGVLARLVSVVMAASGSAYVLLVSIPKLSPPLAEGLATVVEPSTIATVTLGFATLAAGFSARAAAHLVAGTEATGRPAAPEPPLRRLGPWPRRIIGGMVGLVCLEIIAAAVQAILRDLEYRWYIPIGLDAWGAIFRAPASWLGYPTGSSGWFVLFDRPDDFLIGIAAIWLTIRLGALLASKDSGRPSPLDTLATNRLALGRFLGWWVGLTTLMLASLPGLAVVGVTLMHFVIRWVGR
jgi:hypothetical protein